MALIIGAASAFLLLLFLLDMIKMDEDHQLGT